MNLSMASSIDIVARDCIAVRVRLLNRAVTNLFDDALRPVGLKVSQMNILVAAAKMGVARPSEVCRYLHLDVSTLSRNVERMKARGWVEVVPDAADARAQPFSLTPAGRKVLEKSLPLWEVAQERAQLLLGEAAVGGLRSAVRGMTALG
jgi:DNA-binding MarR family transcriptional regulator